jgi:6-pyruvoyltetrahydropterin/6-carboxytetrahydropterin synthase
MYEIKKQFHFSASHVLSNLPEGHQCGRLHGHNYLIEIVLASNELNATGFVRDYGDLKFLKTYLDEKFDHRHLNDVLTFNPTAELMCAHLYNVVKEQAPEVTAIRISETPSTWAEYRP